MATFRWEKEKEIFCNTTDDDDDRYDESSSDSSCESFMSGGEDQMDAYIRDFEQYATTPPRTRILRRHRSSKSVELSGSKRCHWKGRKHKNLTSPLSERGSDSRKRSKEQRHFHRLRGSERDLKLDVMPNHEGSDRLPTIKVESSNRFLSLSCKLVRAASQWKNLQTHCSKTRSEFYSKFSNLIKSGTSDTKEPFGRQSSREEDLWQAELKDLIWLELQAWHAERTPSEQDKYLCEARQAIPHLLSDILNYRFIRKPDPFSTQSDDSGVYFPTPESESPSEKTFFGCPGCLWLFCPKCIEHENAALRDIEDLLSRLEAAEALYPSSRAFSSQYEMYKSEEFNGRVKAMCLWFNVTRHQRLKLMILGKQLLSYTKANDSTGELDGPAEIVLSSFSGKRDIEDIQAVAFIGKFLNQEDGDNSVSYRKFIEDVLKLRGLRKALYFLERLHFTLLRKARISLEKLPDSENGNEVEDEDEENELRRYGLRSVEALSLNLPSFKPAFLFISRIPLDVIHAFLRMRLETKFDKPSSLSIRQLIKELKEGLKLAVVHKQRYLEHVSTALFDESPEVQEKFKKPVGEFDQSLQKVFNLYLNYIEQWVNVYQKECVQKNILKEEWKFITSSALHIPGGEALAGSKFCDIARQMLRNVCDQLVERIEDVTDYIKEAQASYSQRQAVLSMCRDLQSFCLEMRMRTIKVLCLSKDVIRHLENDRLTEFTVVSEALYTLKEEVGRMSEHLRKLIGTVEDVTLRVCSEEAENSSLTSRYREMLHQMYKFGFEYQREVYKVMADCDKEEVAKEMIFFAKQWLQFVVTHCEKGRGVRPRWAFYGLEFLLNVVDPSITDFLDDEEFEKLKREIDCGVSHILGAPTPTPSTTPPTYFSTRSRSASPSPSMMHHVLSYNRMESLSPVNGEAEKPTFSSSLGRKTKKVINRKERVLRATQKLESELDEKLRVADLIGNVMHITSLQNDLCVTPRPVTFGWQRGIKIGQGRFGKVYTAVNNETGELMAMKEIPLQPNDLRTIRNVAVELKIFEGIQHPHLVRYYGAEIHREELLIFMELCTEGTLESLVAATEEKGLPEALVRKYTSQLVSAVYTLHQHSIVHRDIKTANIFLTAEGNCLKLGDFGSAVKIKAHTTVPGELKGFVGTQAYMAPEVFTKTNTDGHGRAADIWSVGCVVIEMASGKRPWSEYDSNYQIMYKVGMGESPEIPTCLSDEGVNFVSLCLVHNPKERGTAAQLKDHTFLKVDTEEECLSCTLTSSLEDYLKLGVRR